MIDPSSNQKIDPSSNQKIDPSLNDQQKLDFIKILAQEENVREKIAQNMFWQHSHNTVTKPVCYYCLDLSSVKILKVPSNLCEEALPLFKQTQEGNKYTVVDVNPDFWTKLFCKKVIAGIEEWEETGTAPIVKIPNGCCGHAACPISLFYRALTIYCYQFNLNLLEEVNDDDHKNTVEDPDVVLSDEEIKSSGH